MDNDLQTQFRQITDHLINSYANLAIIKVDSIRSIRRLNSTWTVIRDCIIKVAKEVIPYYKVTNHSTQRLPKPITQLQLNIKKIN